MDKGFKKKKTFPTRMQSHKERLCQGWLERPAIYNARKYNNFHINNLNTLPSHAYITNMAQKNVLSLTQTSIK